MSERDLIHVFAVTKVIGFERIDSGKTLALRLLGADGGEVMVILAVSVAEALSRELAEHLKASAAQS